MCVEFYTEYNITRNGFVHIDRHEHNIQSLQYLVEIVLMFSESHQNAFVSLLFVQRRAQAEDILPSLFNMWSTYCSVHFTTCGLFTPSECELYKFNLSHEENVYNLKLHFRSVRIYPKSRRCSLQIIYLGFYSNGKKPMSINFFHFLLIFL